MPQIYIQGTSNASLPTNITNKILSDTFMGTTFQSLSATTHNLTLLTGDVFEIDNDLEIGASFSLEVPSTSSLEIKVYVQRNSIQNLGFSQLNFVEYGCLLIAGSATNNCKITEGAVWVNGQRIVIAAQTLPTLGNNADNYVYIDQAGTVTLKGVSANTAPTVQSAQGSNQVLVGIISTSGGTPLTPYQGSTSSTAQSPIVSNQTIQACDFYGNVIYPTAGQTLIGYRQIVSNTALGAVGATPTLVPGLTLSVQVPPNRHIKITAYAPGMNTSTANNNVFMDIWEGAVSTGTQVAQSQIVSTTANFNWNGYAHAFRTPTSATAALQQWPGNNYAVMSVTYNVALHTAAGLTPQIIASSTDPATLTVELV